MDNRFIRAEEVAAELDVSKPYAYKLIRQLNEELKAKGFLTIAGRVNRQYFNERFYGTEKEFEFNVRKECRPTQSFSQYHSGISGISRRTGGTEQGRSPIGASQAGILLSQVHGA